MRRRPDYEAKESSWRSVLARHEQSGLRIQEFCDVENLSFSTLQNWRSEIRRRDRLKASADVTLNSLS